MPDLWELFLSSLVKRQKSEISHILSWRMRPNDILRLLFQTNHRENVSSVLLLFLFSTPVWKTKSPWSEYYYHPIFTNRLTDPVMNGRFYMNCVLFKSGLQISLVGVAYSVLQPLLVLHPAQFLSSEDMQEVYKVRKLLVTRNNSRGD